MSRAVVRVGVVLSGLLAVGCPEPVHEERSWVAFGDLARAEIYMAGTEDARVAFDEFERAMGKIEVAMGFDDPMSELSRLNASAAEGYYRVSDRDLYRCLLLALDYARASRGAFDPTVGPLTRLYRQRSRDSRRPGPDEVAERLPRVGWSQVVVADEARAVHFLVDGMEIDLAGVIKGFALDAAARAFARTGSHAGLLRVGSNLYAWGGPPDETGWSIAVPDPRRADGVLVELRVRNRGVAVAARVESEFVDAEGCPAVPTLDATTGLPADSGVLAAIALADSAADADALSTALLVAGPQRGAELLARMRRVEAVLLVERRGERLLLASGTLRDRIEPSSELRDEVGGRIRYLLPPSPTSAD